MDNDYSFTKVDTMTTVKKECRGGCPCSHVISMIGPDMECPYETIMNAVMIRSMLLRDAPSIPDHFDTASLRTMRYDADAGRWVND